MNSRPDSFRTVDLGPDLRANATRSTAPAWSPDSPLSAAGTSRACPAATASLGDLDRFLVGHRRAVPGRVAPQVEVGGDLAGQVGEPARRRRPAAPGRRARPARRASAGRTRGSSRWWPRRSRPAPGHPAPPPGQLGRRYVGQQRHQRVRAPGGAGQRGGQGRRPRPPAGPGPAAELVGGHPAEGDQHQLAQLDPSLGQIAGGQGGDRVRLARAGAGLQHRGSRRQRTAEVEVRPGRCGRSCQLLAGQQGGRPGGPGCRTGSARPARRAPPLTATPRPSGRPGWRRTRRTAHTRSPGPSPRSGPARELLVGQRVAGVAKGRVLGGGPGANGIGSRSPVRRRSTRSASTWVAQAHSTGPSTERPRTRHGDARHGRDGSVAVNASSSSQAAADASRTAGEADPGEVVAANTEGRCRSAGPLRAAGRRPPDRSGSSAHELARQPGYLLDLLSNVPSARAPRSRRGIAAPPLGVGAGSDRGPADAAGAAGHRPAQRSSPCSAAGICSSGCSSSSRRDSPPRSRKQRADRVAEEAQQVGQLDQPGVGDLRQRCLRRRSRGRVAVRGHGRTPRSATWSKLNPVGAAQRVGLEVAGSRTAAADGGPSCVAHWPSVGGPRGHVQRVQQLTDRHCRRDLAPERGSAPE